MGSSQSSQSYVEDGKRFAKKAQQLDHVACNTQNPDMYKEAMDNYYSAVNCIRKALEHEKESKRREILEEKMSLCLKRVELLKIWNPVGGKCGSPQLLEVIKPNKPKEVDNVKQSSRAIAPKQLELSDDEESEKENVIILRDDTVNGTTMYTLGVELGKKATEEDEVACAAADPELYNLAKRTYHSAVDYFRSALQQEKAEKKISYIEDKIQEYLDRADILDAWAQTKRKTKSAVSSASASAAAVVRAAIDGNSEKSKKTNRAAVTTKTHPKKEERKVRVEKKKKSDSAASVKGSVRSKESSKSHKHNEKKTSSKAISSTNRKKASESKETRSKEKRTTSKRSKQHSTNSKATPSKSKSKCKCGSKSKRRE